METIPEERRQSKMNFPIKSRVIPELSAEESQHRRVTSSMELSNTEDKLCTESSVPATLTSLSMQELMDLSNDLESSKGVANPSET